MSLAYCFSVSHVAHGKPSGSALQADAKLYDTQVNEATLRLRKSGTGCGASRLHSHAAHGNEIETEVHVAFEFL